MSRKKVEQDFYIALHAAGLPIPAAPRDVMLEGADLKVLFYVDSEEVSGGLRKNRNGASRWILHSAWIARAAKSNHETLMTLKMHKTSRT